MKAYIWLSVLIVSVLVAGALLSRTLPGTPSPVHAKEEALHAGCDHAHDDAHAPAASDHGADSLDTTSAPSACADAEHNHTEEDHAGEEDHAEHGHVEHEQAAHEHATHAEPQSACAGDGHEHAEDPHAGHAHAKAADGICPEHQVLEAEDALCLSDHIGELSPGAGMLVRLASPQVGVRAGIRTTTPEAVQLSESFQVLGQLTFARERVASITPLAPGTVAKVHVRPGTRVEQGDLLVQIATPEIARLSTRYSAAVAQHQQATTTLKREEDLHTRGISAAEEVQRARAAWSSSGSEVEQYQRELQSFGLDAEHLDGTNLVPVRAPFAGVITDLQTSGGEGVSPSSALLTLADPDILWLELSIPAAHAASVIPHTPVQVSFDGVDGVLLETELFHVDPALNPQSRTLRALAQISNPEGRLKAGMFARATLQRAGSTAGMSVPADAIQHIDEHSYIFIQREPDLFELRRVTTTAVRDGRVGISIGLDPAHSATTQVVSARGFALKSEVLRARLGASCADH